MHLLMLLDPEKGSKMDSDDNELVNLLKVPGTSRGDGFPGTADRPAGQEARRKSAC